MRRASAAYGNRANDHQLVQAGDVRKLRDRRRWLVATAKHFGQKHLGHPACGVLGVVIAFDVDDQGLQHLAHAGLDLGFQLFDLACFEKRADVVVGEVTLAGSFQTAPDTICDRCARDFRALGDRFRRRGISSGIDGVGRV